MSYLVDLVTVVSRSGFRSSSIKTGPAQCRAQMQRTRSTELEAHAGSVSHAGATCRPASPMVPLSQRRPMYVRGTSTRPG